MRYKSSAAQLVMSPQDGDLLPGSTGRSGSLNELEEEILRATSSSKNPVTPVPSHAGTECDVRQHGYSEALNGRSATQSNTKIEIMTQGHRCDPLAFAYDRPAGLTEMSAESLSASAPTLCAELLSEPGVTDFMKQASNGQPQRSDNKRTFECTECNKTYAKEVTLAMHVRIAHPRPASKFFSEPCKEADSRSTQAPAEVPLRVQKLLEPDEYWRPKMKYIKNLNTKTTTVWGSGEAGYLACGTSACVTIRKLSSMKILQSFSCNAVVNAICGTEDGNILCYGLKSGEVIIRDMRQNGNLLKTVPKSDGRIVALWLSPDATNLVVCSVGRVVVWGKNSQALGRSRSLLTRAIVEANSLPGQVSTFLGSFTKRQPEASKTGNITQSHLDWIKLYESEDTSMNSRWLGQHSLVAGKAAFSWGPELPEGSTLLAMGGSCVTLWYLFWTV